jgi:hypothetical protein
MDKKKKDQVLKTWTLPILADDDGELILEFPDEFMDIVEWQVGDSLKWEQIDNGTWSLTKVKV